MKAEGGGGIIKVYKYLKGRFKGDRAKLFAAACSERMRSNGHYLKGKRLSDHQKVMEQWHRLPREAVMSPSRSAKAIWTWSWAICFG